MTFEQKMIKESMTKLQSILDLTPEKYCISRKISLDHASAKRLAGLEVESKSLLFWLEMSGIFDADTPES